MQSSADLKTTSRLWPVCIGWVAGSALQLQQAALWPAVGYAVLLLCAVVLAPPCWRVQRPVWRQLGLVVTMGVLAFALTGWRAGQAQSGALAPSLEGQDIEIQGVVSAMPERSEGGVRFRLSVERAQRNGLDVTVPPVLQLGWYNDLGVEFDAGTMWGDLQLQSADLRAGERWTMTVRLKAPHGGLNPHGFDLELWLWEQGIQALGYVRAGRRDQPPTRLEQTWQHPVEWLRQKVRDRIEAAVAARQPAGLIAALVVGDQNAIDRHDWDVFRRTGVAHLVSISGLHITMFAWAAMALVGALWRRSPSLCLRWSAPNAAWVSGVLLATLYALFSGWGVPAQRTVLMLWIVGLLRLTGSVWPWPLIWVGTMAVVVAADPWALTQAGFWLSFVAVGVLFATDVGRTAGADAGAALWRQRVRAAVREQWTITLALAPLTLLLFHQVSVVGLLANALAIPWVTLVLTPVAMLGTLWPAAWQAAAWAASALIEVLQWFASWPWASVGVAASPLWVALAALVGALWLAMPGPATVRCLGLVWMWPLLSWQTARPVQGQFELWAPDIGQGNAVLIRTATHSLLYDSGPRWGRESDAGQRVLVPWLQALQEPVHTLVLSHRDSDHTGGAAAVLGMRPEAQLLGSLEPDHPLRREFAMQRCVAGQRWQWDGVHFEVLHPTAADYERPHKSNAMSCVLRVGNGARSVLLAGDIEAGQEARLSASPGPLHADLLLVPHHGSKTSSSEKFLDAVAPSLAVVQAGYRNRFGHPALPVMDRYRERAIRVLASPSCGALQWSSATSPQVECERERVRRYWHHVVPVQGEDTGP